MRRGTAEITEAAEENPEEAISSQTKVERKSKYHHGNLHSALVDAGLHLLNFSGIESLTLRECAKLAGVSQAAIRRHFADKDALLAALGARGFAELALRRQRAVAALKPDSLEAGIKLLVRNYVTFALEFPDMFRIMFALEGLRRIDHADLRTTASVSYDDLCELIKSLLAAEKLDTNDVGSATFMIWSAMHGLAMLLIDKQYGQGVSQGQTYELRIDQIAAHLAAGLRALRSVAQA
jgi:AcrR family transcriptional regulator